MGKLYRRPDSPYWWAWWQDGGGVTRRESTRSADRKVASLFLAARESEVIRADAGVPSARRIGLADAVGLFLAEHRPPVWSEGWYYTVERWWHARLIDDLGGPEVIVSEVTRETAAIARGRWLAGGDETRAVKPPTVNRLTACGSAFWRWAMERGYALDNPFARHRHHAEPPPQVPTMDELTLDRLLAAIAQPVLRRAAAVSADTGLRRSELERARAEDVRDGWLEVVSSYERGHTKTRQPRRVPLTPRALAAIEEQLGDRETGPIFGALPDHRHHLAAACTAVGIRVLRWHDLRHIALTRAADAGALGHDLTRLAGWRSLAMADRYVHPDDARVKDVIDRLGQRGGGVRRPRAKTRKNKHARHTPERPTQRKD